MPVKSYLEEFIILPLNDPVSINLWILENLPFVPPKFGASTNFDEKK